VVAGNVETSQCITDALYGALGVLAASQGTMNNFTFGNERYQYYETVAGGSGAGPGFDGADVVQTHMTNSRLTDPEVLEWRFPVLLERFAIRHGSGGRGRWHGGDGAVRRVRFLEAMTAGTPMVLGPDLPTMEAVLRKEDLGRVAASMGCLRVMLTKCGRGCCVCEASATRPRTRSRCTACSTTARAAWSANGCSDV